jgi:hypothetical protein
VCTVFEYGFFITTLMLSFQALLKQAARVAVKTSAGSEGPTTTEGGAGRSVEARAQAEEPEV